MMSGNDFRLYQGMDSSEFLAHYGRGHLDGGNSGRYKWGSGKNPKQRFGSSEPEKNKTSSDAKLFRKMKPGENREAYINSQKKLMKENPYKYLQSMGVDDKTFDNMVELATKAIKGQASTMDSHYEGRDEVWDAWDKHFERILGKNYQNGPYDLILDDAIIEAIGKQHYNVQTVASTDFDKVNKEVKKKFRDMTKDSVPNKGRDSKELEDLYKSKDPDVGNALEKEIKRVSIDYYNGKPKSEEAKAIWKKYRKQISALEKESDDAFHEYFQEMNNKSWLTDFGFTTKKIRDLRKKYEEQSDKLFDKRKEFTQSLCSVILKDLGFEDNERNRYLVNAMFIAPY